MLRITVKNFQAHSISIQDTDFSVFASTDRTNWKRLKVFRSKEYMANAKSAYIAGTVLMAVGAGLRAANAGRSTATTTGSVYGRGNGGYYSGTYSATTQYYDPAAARAENERSAAQVAEYARNGQQQLADLENNLFYSKDLANDEEYYGVVFSETSSNLYLKVELENQDIQVISIEYERVKD